MCTIKPSNTYGRQNARMNSEWALALLQYLLENKMMEVVMMMKWLNIANTKLKEQQQ